VPQLLGAALVVRLGLPVLSLALPLTLIESGHSYATAGLVLTGHALALAICAPTAGRLVDRFATRPALAWFAAAHAVTYSLLVAAVVVDVPAGLVVAAAALHGVSNPPTSAVVRAALPRLVPEHLLSPAYALDNMTNEVAFIAGPALVSLNGLPSCRQGVADPASSRRALVRESTASFMCWSISASNSARSPATSRSSNLWCSSTAVGGRM
jgi:MFS family permease